MTHRDSRRLLKKNLMINKFEEVLYTEPVGIRQLVGLTTWNNLLAKDNIPKKVLKDM